MAATYANRFFSTLDQRLEPHVKSHLKQVYSTLAVATFVAGLGSYVHLFTDLMSGGIMASIGALGFTIAILATQHDPKNTQKRMYYLMGLAGCSGLAMGPLLEHAIYLNPSFIPMALVSTCLVFASFSLSAVFGTRRKWLYLGGTLMSLLSIMFFMTIINLFLGSHSLYMAQLYLGLFLFCVFVMYDTAMIIEKRRMGDTDYIRHAMFLFTDFVDIFRTFLIVLMSKEKSSNSRHSRQRRWTIMCICKSRGGLTGSQTSHIKQARYNLDSDEPDSRIIFLLAFILLCLSPTDSISSLSSAPPLLFME